MAESPHDLLRRSPFFEPFGDDDLDYLVANARTETYEKGQLLGEEDAPANTLFMLLSGAIRLSFHTAGEGISAGASRQIVVRDVVDPGYPVGWSAAVEPYRYHARITALEDVRVMAFDKQMLERRTEECPQFGVTLMERILWVVGRRLRETRIRLVSRRYKDEVVAIRALLDQNAARLSSDSPLHKIPHYLEHRLTLSDAFDTLRLVRSIGDERERDVAQLCLEILRHVQEELVYFRDLQGIYKTVSRDAEGLSGQEGNELACRMFADLFSRSRHRIVGEENLPEGSGHLFIVNHLSNDLNYLLPNGFHVVLDTNFVAAMIVQKKYGAAPIRVVRKSQSNEYGHKAFYDRVNYIYVKQGVQDADERRRLREEFVDRASGALSSGQNLIMCPEGNCTTTEESPLPFKPSFLQVAARTRPESLIVPVALANFDKKLSSTTLVAVVHKPFRLSDRLSLPADDQALSALAASIHEEFRGYVAEAVRLGDQDADD